jgi:hypothetical protein
MYSKFSHPNSVCMSYFSHLKISFYYSKCMFIGCIKAIIHGIIPSMYLTSTMATVTHLSNELEKNNCKK